MLTYTDSFYWDGRRWIDKADKRYPNCMDPEKCAECRTKYVVTDLDGLCYACSPSEHLWRAYQIEASKRGRPAPE